MSIRFDNKGRMLLILLLLSSFYAMQIAKLSQFNGITGYLCINSSFVDSYYGDIRSVGCAALCSSNPRCQAFSTADGPCQLFVFDACSKSVRNCSCSRRGQVFVKQQPGLQPGALCPSGYGDDLCGVKYRLFNDSGNWSQSRQKCESQSGLVIMADVLDAAEVSRVEAMHGRLAATDSFWLGGHQTPGSPEPFDGWRWVSCNIALSGRNNSLWVRNEPNDWKGAWNNWTGENAIARHISPGINDVSDAVTLVGYACECVSPFD